MEQTTDQPKKKWEDMTYNERLDAHYEFVSQVTGKPKYSYNPIKAEGYIKTDNIS